MALLRSEPPDVRDAQQRIRFVQSDSAAVPAQTHLHGQRGELEAAVGRRDPVVRGGLLEQRVLGGRLDVELDDEVGDEDEGHVEEEVGGEDEEEGRGVVLGVTPSRRSAQRLR